MNKKNSPTSGFKKLFVFKLSLVVAMIFLFSLATIRVTYAAKNIPIGTGPTDTVNVLGSLGVGTNSPSYKLDVQGQINTSLGLCIAGECRTSWGAITGGNYWSLSGTDVYTNSPSYKVGIGGMNNGDSRLFVDGNISISGGSAIYGLDSYWGLGAGDLYINSVGEFAGSPMGDVYIGSPVGSDSSGGNVYLSGTGTGGSGNVFVGGMDNDNIPSGNLFVYDSIGIGTTNPTQRLHVAGGAQFGSLAWGVTPAQTQNLALATVEYVNAKSGGSGGISAGTTGQTLRHSGAGWVANSILYNNGTNIGIGTVTPGQKLDVIGSVRTNSQFISTAANGTAPLVVSSQTLVSNLNADLLDNQQGTYYDHRVYNVTDNYLGAGYNGGGTEKPNWAGFGAGKLKLQMLSGSNIGAPDSWNDVLWMSAYTGSDVKGSNALIFSKSSDRVGFVRQNYDSTTWGTYREFYHTGNSNLSTVNWNANNLYTAGNVGIGTASPNQKLDVAGAAQLGAVSWGVTPGVSQSLALATVAYVNASLTGGVWTKNSTNVSLSAINDNVGIGTTAPAAKLQVTTQYSGLFGEDGMLKIKSVSGGSCPGCGTESVVLQTSIDGRSADYSVTDIGGEQRHVLSLQPQGGFVGIGTLTPLGNMHVKSATTSATNLIIESGGAAGSRTDVTLDLKRQSVYDKMGLRFYTTSTNNFFMGVPYNGGVDSSNVFMIGNSEAISSAQFLINNGNIGIGTASPAVKLDVNGGLKVIDSASGLPFIFGELAGVNRIRIYPTGASIRFLNSANGYANLGFGSLSIGSYAANSAPTSGAIIEGNVGIGTTIPNQKLDVAGAAQLGAVSWGVTPGSGQTLALATVGYVAGAISAAGSGVGAGSYGQTLRHNGSTWVADSNLYNDGTNVGIGTVSPAYQLDISRYVEASAVNIAGPSVVSRNATGIDFSAINGNSRVYAKIGLQVTNGGAGSETGGLTFFTKHYGTMSEKMFIQSNGNVGIGTTNPFSKLTVYGDIYSSGNVFGSNIYAGSLHLADGYYGDEMGLYETNGNSMIATYDPYYDTYYYGNGGMSMDGGGNVYASAYYGNGVGITGVVSAKTLSTNRTNWANNGVISAVVGQLVWKHHGNGHTIFDASNSTSPSGSTVNNTNSQVAWSGTYPTLMGWNGTNTYGVRVDTARLAESLGSFETNPNNSHPGYGLKTFYSWDTGAAYSASTGYSTGITIGSKPSDPNYGFQLVQNMWDDHLYMRRYNSGWQDWLTLIDNTNINSYVNSIAMPLNGGVNVNFDIASNSNTAQYYDAAIELRELNHGGAQNSALSEAPRLAFHWGGKVASQIALGTDGTIMIRNASGQVYENFRANIITGSSFNYESDITLKKNISTISDPINKILNLRGVTFDWKKDDKAGIGLIAQEVEKVYPELVQKDSDGIKSVQYGNLVAPLIEAVKAQQAEIETLSNRIKVLETKKK